MAKRYNNLSRNIYCPDIEIGAFNTISGNVEFGKNVTIGNNCTISGNIKIGDNCRIENNISIVNNVIIGAGNSIYSGVCIGYEPQHLKYYLNKNILSDKHIIIGNGNIIRENATIHQPFTADITSVGNNCFIMANAHISHDSVIGDNVIITNNVAIGGHCNIGNYANLGLNSCLHPFCRVGAYAMLGMGSVAVKDIPPFHTGSGHRTIRLGLNLIGFKRNYKGSVTLQELKDARRNLIEHKTLRDISDNDELRSIFNNFSLQSKNGIYIL